MRGKNRIALFCMTALFTLAGAFIQTDTASAQAIASREQAEAKALQKVKNATVVEVDYDDDDGVAVYEVELVKGSKKYGITYRASDGKMLSYGWEKKNVDPRYDKALVSQSTCEAKAQKKAPGATIASTQQKVDDGIDIYKIRMTSDTRKYTLKYHARTGALIEYEWDLVPSSPDSSGTDNGYISAARAKEIARNKVPGATVVKCRIDTEDGVRIYEVKLVKGTYEYEIEIDAKTGRITKYEREIDD